MKYYARTDRQKPHLLPDDPGAHWQTLRDHLLSVAQLAENYARDASPQDSTFIMGARLAGLLHDLGKYSDGFQKMLMDSVKRGALERVVHSIFGAGVAFSRRRYDIALAVLGHHAGLHAAGDLKFKCRPNDVSEAESLYAGRALAVDGLKIDWSEGGEGSGAAGSELDLRVRMLFSCLIDADRSDCVLNEKGSLPQSPLLEPESQLRQALDYVKGRAAAPSAPAVREARARVLEACLEAAGRPDRLFSLAVPTGGGKTLSSMAFALRRALLRPGEVRRVIVVMPYLTIIEQNAAVLKAALGMDSVLEHHSGDTGALVRSPSGSDLFAAHDESETSSIDWIRQLATENWDAPIVLTTSVRFFESLYSNRPSDLRRLHNIARSVVILDEVQLLPKGFLGTLLSMIRGLADQWGTTFLFSTATQPAFEKSLSGSEDDMRWPPGTVVPIIAPCVRERLFSGLRRVRDPVWPGANEKCSWPDLAQSLLKGRRTLCIVNTKKHAATLYALVRQGAEAAEIAPAAVLHLSARMCAEHRLAVILRIRQLLAEESGACIVISTQLIEAGVDLDFPAVYRAMAPLDSVIQAAGRCDREGRISDARGEPAGQLVVFEPESAESPYPEAVQITRGLAARGALSIHNPEHVRTYFNELYEGDRDPQDIEGLRRKLDFPEVSKRFAMIDDRTQSVLVPYDCNAESLIAEIEGSRGYDRELLRRAQRIQVGLYPNEFDEAVRLGSVVELWQGAGLWKARRSCYSPEVGLQIVVPSPEDLMVMDEHTAVKGMTGEGDGGANRKGQGKR